jgi:CRP-like cAMP-binding protein
LFLDFALPAVGYSLQEIDPALNELYHIFRIGKKVDISNRTGPGSEEAATDRREQERCGILARPPYGAHETENYFQSLFSSSDADLHGWSPPHEYPRGVELFLQNHPASHVYFIERGIVKLSCVGPGAKEVIVSLRRRNWLLAATAVILGVAYSATATTLTKCTLRSIPAAVFAGHLTSDICLSLEVNRMLSTEILGDRGKIVTLGCMSAAERLRRFLRELISEEDLNDPEKKGRLELPLKSYELAEIVAVTPQHLYRLLRDPGMRKHLKQARGILTITDPSAFMLNDNFESN